MAVNLSVALFAQADLVLGQCGVADPASSDPAKQVMDVELPALTSAFGHDERLASASCSRDHLQGFPLVEVGDLRFASVGVEHLRTPFRDGHRFREHGTRFQIRPPVFMATKTASSKNWISACTSQAPSNFAA